MTVAYRCDRCGARLTHKLPCCCRECCYDWSDFWSAFCAFQRQEDVTTGADLAFLAVQARRASGMQARRVK
jgi:hypothetical protein